MYMLYNPNPKVSVLGFSTQIWHYELMKTIVSAYLGFRMLEYPQLRRLINILWSINIVPSANTLPQTMYAYTHTIHVQLKDIMP